MDIHLPSSRRQLEEGRKVLSFIIGWWRDEIVLVIFLRLIPHFIIVAKSAQVGENVLSSPRIIKVQTSAIELALDFGGVLLVVIYLLIVAVTASTIRL